MNSLSSKKTKNKNTNINSVNNKSMKNIHKKIDDSFKNKCVNKLFRTKTNFLDPLQTNTQATKDIEIILHQRIIKVLVTMTKNYIIQYQILKMIKLKKTK